MKDWHLIPAFRKDLPPGTPKIDDPPTEPVTIQRRKEAMLHMIFCIYEDVAPLRQGPFEVPATKLCKLLMQWSDSIEEGQDYKWFTDDRREEIKGLLVGLNVGFFEKPYLHGRALTDAAKRILAPAKMVDKAKAVFGV